MMKSAAYRIRYCLCALVLSYTIPWWIINPWRVAHAEPLPLANPLPLAQSLPTPATPGNVAETTHSPRLYVFMADYAVTKGGLPIARSRRSLTQLDNNTFVFESETRSVGVAKFFSNAHVYERSQWRLKDNQVRPQQYLYKNQNAQKKRHVQLVFDWKKNMVTNIINGSPWTMATTPGVNDKLSYQVQLTLDLSNNPDIAELSYPVADGGKIKTFHLQIHGNEILDINEKKYSTIKLSRKNKGKITTFWCATELLHLPVKIEQKLPDGSVITATLEQLNSFNPVTLLSNTTSAAVPPTEKSDSK